VDRLTVLGGGSPFTLGLVESLVADLDSPPMELVLYGRDAAVLELVRRYTASRMEALGWKVEASTDLGEALSGARYVLHQIRYGGLEGRTEDEMLAARLGVAADETLGPGALNSALRMAPQLRIVARAIGSVAPDAWVLNLTNPLSVATSLLLENGVKRCIGLCELPASTARMVATTLGCALGRLNWSYRGLNHLGFIVGLEYQGKQQLDCLLARLGTGDLGGIPAATIAMLRAIPTKYFALVHGTKPPAPGRAEYVRRLRQRIVEELSGAPSVLPPSLRLRRLPWYAESVVPALAALASPRARRLIVNLRCEDGITREMQATVSADGITPEAPPTVSPAIRDYLEIFELHEQRVLEAVADPSYETVAYALAADPTLDSAPGSPLVDTVWEDYSRHATSASSRVELS
jgi:6-phospho-beta-glucosidase